MVIKISRIPVFKNRCTVFIVVATLFLLCCGVLRQSTLKIDFSKGIVYSQTLSTQAVTNFSSLKSDPNKPGKLPKNVRVKIEVFMNDTMTQRQLPPETPGAFLHVGKAGGSTLCSVLLNACHSFIGKPCEKRKHFNFTHMNETYMSALTTYIHTPDFHLLGRKPEYSDFSFYIATIRDPLTKFQSAFTYLHPGNGFVGVKEGEKKKMQNILFLFPIAGGIFGTGRRQSQGI